MKKLFIILVVVALIVAGCGLNQHEAIFQAKRFAKTFAEVDFLLDNVTVEELPASGGNTQFVVEGTAMHGKTREDCEFYALMTYYPDKEGWKLNRMIIDEVQVY